MILKQLGINSLWLLFARVLTQGLSVLFIAIVARNLGVRIFGQYTILASIVYLGNVFTTYGVDVLLIREMARERQITQLASTALWVQIYLSLLWCVIFLIGSFPFLTRELTVTLFLYNLSLLPLAFYTVCSSTLRAFERMDLFMGINLCGALLQVLGALMLVKTSYNLPLLCIWLVTAQVVTALVGVFLCKAYVPAFSLQIKPVFGDVMKLIRSGWRIALFSPLGLLSQRLNLFMLSSLVGDVSTGWFSAPARLVEGLKLGHFAVTNSLMPSMSRPVSPEGQKTHKFSFYGLLLWSFVVAIIVTFMANPIVSIIYGIAFVPSVAILKIIIWVLIPYTFSIYFSLTLIMRGAEALVLNANLICLIIAAGLYLFLIPRFGVHGAAWGTLSTEVLQAATLFILSCRLSPSINNVLRIP